MVGVASNSSRHPWAAPNGQGSQSTEEERLSSAVTTTRMGDDRCREEEIRTTKLHQNNGRLSVRRGVKRLSIAVSTGRMGLLTSLQTRGADTQAAPNGHLSASRQLQPFKEPPPPPMTSMVAAEMSLAVQRRLAPRALLVLVTKGATVFPHATSQGLLCARKAKDTTSEPARQVMVLSSAPSLSDSRSRWTDNGRERNHGLQSQTPPCR